MSGVVEGLLVVDCEHYDKGVGVGVGQSPQVLELGLAGGVPRELS